MKRILILSLTLCLIFTFSMARAENIGFEDLSLLPESFWNGSDGSGGFNSGGVHFSNNYNADPVFWDGFSYSNLTDTTAEGIAAQYNAIAGSGQQARWRPLSAGAFAGAVVAASTVHRFDLPALGFEVWQRPLPPAWAASGAVTGALIVLGAQRWHRRDVKTPAGAAPTDSRAAGGAQQPPGAHRPH